MLGYYEHVDTALSHVKENEYIATDEVALKAAEFAVNDMGSSEQLSAILFDGPPGTGKTFLAKILAKRLQAKYLYFACFLGITKNEILYDKDSSGQIIDGILPQAIKLSHNQKVLLLIDETDKADEDFDSFFLGFIQDNIINLPQLGELRANSANLLIVLTKNDRRDLTFPLMRRCRCVNTSWPTPEVEMKIMKQHLPHLTDEHFTPLIQIANKIRENAGILKKPSTPELIRLLRDVERMITDKTDTTTIGRYILNALAPRPMDQPKINDNVTFMGRQMEEAFLLDASSVS